MNFITFLLKLFGTFVVLSLIIVLGKLLKNSETLSKEIPYDPMYEESVATINKMHQDIELQIRLENEKRAEIFMNGRQ